MKLKQQTKRIIPAFLERARRSRREKKELRLIPRLACDSEKLRPMRDVDLKELFDSPEVETMWEDSKKRMDAFTIPDGTGGVNPGDRRAIYYLVGKLKPASVLEIGTHIGASTLHIASALSMCRMKADSNANLVSVDTVDVNDPTAKTWTKYGMEHSPVEMIKAMGFDTLVEFVKDTSLNYFAGCERTFDFIFLDGDHAGKTVYQEIPAALNLLNENGTILLHDYYPNLKPLWSNGTVIPGPFLATERLRHEGANMAVLPLSELPWPTKLHSHITSLALVLRNQ
jgi:predicted O-methyltransferase YrrM